MDLAWLRDFEALAEAGNFSRAAEARHVTQPAFSRRVRALEHWAGTPLFERATQPVVPTEAGARLRPLLAEIVRRLDEAREEAGAVAGGSLRFAATHALSFDFFPAWLRGRERHLPAVPIQLISDGLDACERLMAASRAEFLLCHAHPNVPLRLEPPRFRARRVGRDRLLLVSAPDRDGRPLHAADDPAAPVLAYGAGSGLARIVATARGPAGRTAFTSHLAATLRGLARDGRGLAWLPESLAAADLASGTLVPASPEGMIPVDIVLIAAAEGGSRAGRAFWAALPPEEAGC